MEDVAARGEQPLKLSAPLARALEKLEREGATVSREVIPTARGERILISVEHGVRFPRALGETLAQYAENHVYTDDDTARRDCASVAGTLVLDLRSAFEKGGFGLSTISSDARGGPVPLFKEHGFGHHVINLAEGDICAALDVTARYTMDNEQGNVDIFVLTAKSLPELIEKLNTFSGSKWEAL